MSESPTPAPLADWLRGHIVPVTHLDPDGPLDDLEPLREIIGAARVVAIGESSHFITEFQQMRQRLLRFLVERCGFTVLAFEYGFSEGILLDDWAQGAGTDDELAARLAGTIPIGVGEPLRWIRRYNGTAATPVRFAGIDIPAAGGSLLPALGPVADYLREVDPQTLPAVEKATRIAATFAGASAASAAPAWSRVPAAERDTLSAILARLLIRFRAVESMYVSRSDQRGYDVARHRLEAACHADYGFGAMADLFAGTGLTADTSARDSYMAESVLWQLRRSEPGTRIVLAAHNAHIQKEPVSFDGQNLAGFPMGHHLHRTLGDDYVALGLTSAAGQTADMLPDENAPFGFTVAATPLEPGEPGSIEAAFGQSGVGPGFADLRGARRAVRPEARPNRTRLQSAYLHVPVLDAFDGMLDTAISTVADLDGGTH
ncbi:erythromycin esterase family protein [Nocardia africana]|uniref:Erythromycin esterase n=1 Tax=Nocardia africana TaxID=134964 RepID=A0A378X5E2_9NOCA|nr:erythromycin esterase family protein [Nocardia africana]MCC3317612.1 erythromycin esterase family protein [Nocardia africana]SUA48372.1 Erythromycin esterase [Nocardia africana]